MSYEKEKNLVIGGIMILVGSYLFLGWCGLAIALLALGGMILSNK